MFDLTLSFDNGPEPEITPAVLEVLARRGVRATFFVIGQKLADPARRALAERAAAEGHWIGNHSYTHSLPLGLRTEPDIAEREIGRTQKLMGTLVHPKRWFRPFGGGGNLDRRLLNPGVVYYLERWSYTCVLWNAIPRDWDDPDGWVETALAQCRAQPWTLMVLHDLPTGAMRHLDRFLDAVGAAGGRIRQEFPPACVPIAEGIPVLPLDDYVALPTAANMPTNSPI
jgi:peptidoglycan/xylan/chitin deacetylase (PgdA/CDA1 family)